NEEGRRSGESTTEHGSSEGSIGRNAGVLRARESTSASRAAAGRGALREPWLLRVSGARQGPSRGPIETGIQGSDSACSRRAPRPTLARPLMNRARKRGEASAPARAGSEQ